MIKNIKKQRTSKKSGNQAEFFRLHKILKAKSDCNKAIIQSKNEQEYLEKICKIIVDYCGHTLVWIGLLENNKEKSIRPVCHAGFEEGYLRTLKVTWADSERGQGPTGRAARAGKPQACQNMLTDPKFLPWRKEAKKRGYSSSLSIPIKKKEKVIGTITIYSKRLNSFSRSETQLLSELAEDIGHGIVFFRLKIANEKVKEELRQNEEKYRTLFKSMNEGFALCEIIVDDLGNPYDYRILEINGAYEKLTGLRAQDVEGKTTREIFPESETSWVEIYGKVALTGEATKFENYNPKTRRHYETFCSSPAKGKFTIMFTDTSERKKAEEQIIYSSTHDALTGLHNRYFFERQLQKYKRTKDFNGGVIMVDINRLKKINDEHGHLMGDKIIQETANFLAREFREKDLVVRFGGDEFCILLPDTEPEEVNAIIGRLQDKIDLENADCEENMKLDVAIGTAYARKGKELDAALQLADKEMYKHKFSKKGK